MIAHWVEYNDLWIALNILICNLGFIICITLASNEIVLFLTLTGFGIAQIIQWIFVCRLQRIRDEDWTSEILQPL